MKLVVDIGEFKMHRFKTHATKKLASGWEFNRLFVGPRFGLRVKAKGPMYQLLLYRGLKIVAQELARVLAQGFKSLCHQRAVHWNWASVFVADFHFVSVIFQTSPELRKS